MILARLRYPGTSTSFFAYSGSLTPSVAREIRSNDVSSSDALPRFSRRSAVVRMIDRFTLIWSNLTADEVRLVLLDYESAASRGVRRLSYTPDDRTSPVDVLLGRPTVTRSSAVAWTLSLVLEAQS